jgi:hypothetical protein
MLWWFLILGVSTAVVVSVALTLYMRVRRQMKRSAAHRAELDGLDHSSPPEGSSARPPQRKERHV